RGQVVVLGVATAAREGGVPGPRVTGPGGPVDDDHARVGLPRQDQCGGRVEATVVGAAGAGPVGGDPAQQHVDRRGHGVRPVAASRSSQLGSASSGTVPSTSPSTVVHAEAHTARLAGSGTWSRPW